MRAFSLWQPWASLVIHRLKEWETRGWKTDYRGQIALHAAKHWTADEAHYADHFRKQFPDLLLPALGPAGTKPPLGAVLGIVELVDIQPTESIRVHLSSAERAFGNYQNGRYAWRLKVIEVFEQPIPQKGAQGFWHWQKPAPIQQEINHD